MDMLLCFALSSTYWWGSSTAQTTFKNINLLKKPITKSQIPEQLHLARSWFIFCSNQLSKIKSKIKRKNFEEKKQKPPSEN